MSLDQRCTLSVYVTAEETSSGNPWFHKEAASKIWPFSLESNIVFITQEYKQIFSGKERDTSLFLLFGHVFQGKHFLSLIGKNVDKSEHIVC